MSTVDQYIEARSSLDPNDVTVISLKSQAAEELGNCYGSLRNKAIALLVMHWSTLGGTDGSQSLGTTGNVKSEKEGQLSRVMGFHGSFNIKDPFLSQTSYGLELLKLNRKTLITPMNRTVLPC